MKDQAAGHILVADDHQINQTLFKGFLEHAGYRVTLAANGAEVLSALRTTAFDLIIMDCMMPVMDGFEATQSIRSSSSELFDPGIPILATTAMAKAEDRERCLAAGMDDYLSKPVESELLFRKVQQLIRRPRPVPRPRTDSVPQIKAILHSMSDKLRRDLTAWQADLRELGASGDRRQASALAHKIRGLADLMGDVELSELAAGVETQPGCSGPGEHRRRIEALICALDRRERQFGSND